MKEIIHSSTENFKNDVITEKEKAVLVDFWAPWCNPCKMIAPILDELNETRDDIKIVKIDVDENKEIAAKYGVRGIPTLMMIQDGEVIGSKTGAITKSNLTNWIDGLL